MYFRAPVNVPEGLKDAINQQTKPSSRRILTDEEALFEGNSINIAVVRQDGLEDDEAESSEPLLQNWTLTQLDKDGIKIDLELYKPLEQISQGLEPDLLFVQLELSAIQSEDGRSLPQSVIK